VNDYFVGSVTQLVERGRLLRATIPENLPRDFHALAQACHTRLADILDRLQSLLDDPDMQSKNNQAERLRRFKRAVADMDLLETVGIAALSRANDEDRRLNRLITLITHEIQYPLLPPVVTALSQQYFGTYYHLNLICVPLTEGRFLLHLPDLYHELAHLLITEQNNLVVEPFQRALDDAVTAVLGTIAEELIKQERRRGPEQLTFLLRCWEHAWVKFWAVEFFCDLFAVYTLGPAFAWANLHLCAKRGANPFAVPTLVPTSHPADDARMTAILHGLTLIGFSEEIGLIQERWQELIAVSGFQPEPEFRRCFPEGLLQELSQRAYEGTLALGCRMAHPGLQDPIHSVLSQAWTEFWRDPARYTAWEESAVKCLGLDDASR
jgi:hypothetical protein